MGFCSKCGTQFVAEAAFCGECGATVRVATESPSGASGLNTPTTGDEAVKLFIGKNYDYFLKSWNIAEKKTSKHSWNWAAFIVGFGWMAYRKMYLYAWIFIGAVVVEALCEIAFGFSGKISNAINLGIAVAFGMHGNYLYKLHVEKKTKEIMSLNASEQIKIELSRQGGTSIGAAAGFVFALLLILILVGLASNKN